MSPQEFCALPLNPPVNGSNDGEGAVLEKGRMGTISKVCVHPLFMCGNDLKKYSNSYAFLLKGMLC